jgi:hypothetical protein
MTFYHYLKTRRITDNPRGDFIKDALSFGGMTAKISDWRSFEAHLFRMRACPEAITAGRKVWREYQKWIRVKV